MEFTEEPKPDLASTALPHPLFRALKIIFSNKLDGVVLVGGTALAGFYAGHRSSDDIDLFTSSPEAFEAAIRAVNSLKNKGAAFGKVFRSLQYFKTTCTLENHSFTIDVVLDENFFGFAKYKQSKDGIVVADLETILMTKISTLLSRCSEKDLFDLMWLLQHFPSISFPEIIKLGQKIDAGFNGESLLLAVTGATIRAEGCGFAEKQGMSAAEVLKKIKGFKRRLEKGISLYLHNAKDTTGIQEVIKYVRSLEKK